MGLLRHLRPVRVLHARLIERAVLLDLPIQRLQYDILVILRPLLIQYVHLLVPLIRRQPEHLLAADLVVADLRVGALRLHLVLAEALRVFEVAVLHHLRPDGLEVVRVVETAVGHVRGGLAGAHGLVVPPLIRLSHHVPVLARLLKVLHPILQESLFPRQLRHVTQGVLTGVFFQDCEAVSQILVLLG